MDAGGKAYGGQGKGSKKVPNPINIPGRQPSRQQQSRHQGSRQAGIDTQRSTAKLPSQGGDWGFVPMTGYAPKAEVEEKSVLLPSQGGGWGFACESVVTPGVLESDNSMEEAYAADEKAEKEKNANNTTPSRKTGMAIDCSPAGVEELRSRAGERPKSRVPSRGIATDLGECRPPTKQRNKTPAKHSQEKKEKRQQGENASGGGHPHYSHTKVRGVSRGYGVSKAYGGGASAHSSSGMYSREGNKSRGFGGYNRGFGGGRGAGGQYGGAGGQYGMMRRGSGQGDAMTIKCDAYSRTGQMGGTMSFGQA